MKTDTTNQLLGDIRQALESRAILVREYREDSLWKIQQTKAEQALKTLEDQLVSF